jgi:hypothetical protein
MRERVEHVVHGWLRLEETEREKLRGGDARTDETAALEKGAAGKVVVHGVVR